MSDEPNRSLPPELRKRLEREAPAEREALEHVWRLLEQGRPAPDSPDAGETWHALQARLSDDRLSADDKDDKKAAPSRRAAPRPPVERGTHRRPARRRWAAAAVLLVALIGGLLLWRQPVRVSAAPGETVAVALPDGSSVELNSGTTLSYRRGFEALPFVPAPRRVVRLRGEAFFEVEQGARPFVVETFNARVEVLGTRFNVRARPEPSARVTRVTLAEGRVQLAARQAPDRAVTLSAPGQSSRVVGTAAAPTPPQPASVDRVLAWRQEGFAISNQPLAAIFDELERRYAVRIRVEARTVRSDSMTLFYPQPVGVETILHDICVARGLNYRPTSRGYTVFRDAASAV